MGTKMSFKNDEEILFEIDWIGNRSFSIRKLWWREMCEITDILFHIFKRRDIWRGERSGIQNFSNFAKSVVYKGFFLGGGRKRDA